ncbi:MAG: winged helix-turn-helix domain-containing protein [Sphingosinicella sp.]
MASAATFLVDTPERLRALADPLRQRLLQQFIEPRTVAQAAKRLQVPLTRLYHHVDQLLAAGLIRVVAEQRKRATIERTFQAVARRFAVSPTAIGEGGEVPERADIVRAALEEALAEASSRHGTLRLLRTRRRLSVAAREKLEAAIADWLDQHEDEDEPEVELVMMSVEQAENDVTMGVHAFPRL